MDNQQIDDMAGRILAVRKLCSANADEFPQVHLSVSDDDELEVPEEHDPAEPPEGWQALDLGRRVVSVSSSGTVKTLHEVGKCFRRPGVHYRQFTFLDENERGEYHQVCKQCFPKQLEDSDDESPTEVQTDSSSSSDSD